MFTKISILSALLISFSICESSNNVEAISTSSHDGSNPSCNPRQVDPDDPEKLICVCTKDTCSDLSHLAWPERDGQVYMYSSSAAGKRLEFEETRVIEDDDDDSIGDATSSIYVDLNRKHQTILGWGGAFTDAFGYNVKSLSKEVQLKLLESYYGSTGLQYNFGRVPLGGSDFSTRNYSYDDSLEPDFELKKWSLAHEDHDFKIPLIKDSLNIAKSRGIQLKLFAAPWSAPAWMKTNKSLVRGHLNDTDEVYRTYTEYLMKFYRAYKDEGITFWGASVQNEPVSSNLPFYFFNSMQWTNSEMIKFITMYLGPALLKEGYTKDNFKLMVGEDSLGFLNMQVPEVLGNEEIHKYVSGLSFHWYTSGSIVPYSELNKIYQPYKKHIEFLMMSEACEGSMPNQDDVDLGSWYRGESYAKDIIEDLNRETSAWIDWNLALDLQGGPNWAGNRVDSPILVNYTSNEFYKQPMYYALAHFTRFLKPGLARMVESGVRKHTWFGSNPMLTTFYDSQNRYTIIVLLNKSSSKMNLNINVKLEHGKKIARVKGLEVDPKSINSVIIRI